MSSTSIIQNQSGANILTESNLAKLLADDEFVITSEISPPRGANHKVVQEKLDLMKGYCDAINVTDNVRGIPSMSSLASSHLVMDSGIEPIMQLTTRDKNRVALQSDLYGAYALGIRNVLFITGDHSYLGPFHNVSPVYDIDSIQALELANRLTTGFDLDDSPLEGIPHFYLGTTFNQHALDIENEVHRVKAKYEAGAEFFQSQAVFDVDLFSDFIDQISDLPIKILAGVIPLKSPESAEFMNNGIPGIDIPNELIENLRSSGAGYSEEQALEFFMEEGLKIALDIISKLQELDRINGIHIMGVSWEESLPYLVKNSGIYNQRIRG